MFRTLGMLLVCCFAAGCSVNRLPWPANIGGFNGFSDAQKTTMLSAIDGLNKQAGTQLVSTGQNLAGHYTLYFELADPPANSPTRAGYATVDASQTVIQISTTVFKPEYVKLIPSVTWHEIGHAGGLIHVSDKSEVMYPVTVDFDSYSEDALSRFSSSLVASSEKTAPSVSAAVLLGTLGFLKPLR